MEIFNSLMNLQSMAFVPHGHHTRWASFENPKAQKGQGGKENFGAKGHPCDHLYAGKEITLMEYQGAGIVNRIWLTLGDRCEAVLRSVVLRCYWDNAKRPAVEVPLGDFMGGIIDGIAYENALFSNPEGRSFNCYIPMPFRTGAKITLTNEAEYDIERLFYDVNFTILDKPNEELCYFHSVYRRSSPVALGIDHEIVPFIEGKGRFLGAWFSVSTDEQYGDTWWGEGEVKCYLDGDKQYPTLVGTGTEDYIGTAWGQGTYVGKYQGCTVADPQKRHWCFYRFHLCDPVYFSSALRVTIQDIGGGSWEMVKSLSEKGVPLIPVTCDGGIEKGYQQLYQKTLNEWPTDGWINFYRCDDIATTAYLYLDKPEGVFNPIAPLEERLLGIKTHQFQKMTRLVAD